MKNLKTIGLIGGMSWESSIEYYRMINQDVRARLGGVHSARIIMHSVDFDEYDALMQVDDWDGITDRLITIAKSLQDSGADCLLVCSNTMHKVADRIQSAIEVPLLHIADATGEAVVEAGLRTVSLLGTRVTMEADFYKTRLIQNYGLNVLIPDQGERESIHRIIFEELVLGLIEPGSRGEYVEIIAGLIERGAQGIILGCTEIGLLVRQPDVAVPVFDTAVIHARRAVEFALSDPSSS